MLTEEWVKGVDRNLWSDLVILHTKYPDWDKERLLEQARKMLNSDIRSEGCGGKSVDSLPNIPGEAIIGRLPRHNGKSMFPSRTDTSFADDVMDNIDLRRDAQTADTIERAKAEHARQLAVSREVLQGWLADTSEEVQEGYEWWVLIKVKKYTYEAVAEKVKKSIGTVKSRVSRTEEALDDIALKAKLSHISTPGRDVVMDSFQKIRELASDHKISDQERWTHIGELLNEIPEEHRQTAFYHLAMAQKLWKHDGDYPGAELHLQQALKWAGNNAEQAKVYNEFGLIAEVQGRRDEYLYFVYRACSVDPSHPAYKHNLLEAGTLLDQDHTIKVALREIVKCLKSDTTPQEHKDYLRKRLRENPKLNEIRALRYWKDREKYWQEDV